MKRFYCSIHKKIVHVRVMPSNVTNASSDNPKLRVGTCQFHDSHLTRDAVNKRVHIHKAAARKAPSAPAPAKAKSKKG